MTLMYPKGLPMCAGAASTYQNPVRKPTPFQAEEIYVWASTSHAIGCHHFSSHLQDQGG
jgi:hypothetical protein